MPAFLMNGVAAANPSVGKQVLMSSFSGPSGSPLDAKKADPATAMTATEVFIADTTNLSTGALSTGIGFGLNLKDGPADNTPGINQAFVTGETKNFSDDYRVGVTNPDGTARADSCLVAIGGGKSAITAGAGSDWSRGTSAPVPYTAGFGLLGFGGGGSRDAGAGPAFTGFEMKMVTSTGTVAVGAAIEATFLNRESFALATAISTFGSSNAASAAPV